MAMRNYSIPVFAFLLATTAAPALAQNKEHVQMEMELRMLQEQNLQLSLANQQAMEAIKALNGRFDAVMEAMRKNQADLALAVKNIAGEVSTNAERGRETDSRLRTISDNIQALQSTLTALGNALVQNSQQQTGAVADPNAPPSAAAPAAGGPLSIPSLGLNPGDLFTRARGDYYTGDYPTAITGLQEVIAKYPNTEYAAEAQFWIGESRYMQKRWPDAIAAFTAVLEKSPRALYAPDAAYHRGEALNASGDAAGAKASWELAVKNYPNSNAAGLAQQRLDGLARQNQNTPPKR